MAIDDNTSYELTGAQVKDLASKIKAKADSSSLATVATSGNYNDLTNQPTIPTVNDATLTIQQNGSTVGTFTANASSNTTINLTDSGASYTAGNGISIDANDEISIDTTVVAEVSDIPTQTSDLTNNGSDGTSTYVESDELATVATSGSYNDLSNRPTIPNGQKLFYFDINPFSSAALTNGVNVEDENHFATTWEDVYDAYIDGGVIFSDGLSAESFYAPTRMRKVYDSQEDTTSLQVSIVRTLSNGKNGNASIQCSDWTSGYAEDVYTGTAAKDEAFTGTNGTTNGTAGLVPAPITTDAGKFLKADGTWGTYDDPMIDEAACAIKPMSNAFAQTLADNYNDAHADPQDPSSYISSLNVKGAIPFMFVNQSGEPISTLGTVRNALKSSNRVVYNGTDDKFVSSHSSASGYAKFGLFDPLYSEVKNYKVRAGNSSDTPAFKQYLPYIIVLDEYGSQDAWGYTDGTESADSLIDAPETKYQIAHDANGNLYMASDATSAGDWKQISNVPAPTVNDGALIIKHNGAVVNSFTANQSTNVTANIETIYADTISPATAVDPITASMIAGGTSASTLANGALVEVVGTTTGSFNYAWKFADGRLICFQKYTVTSASMSSWGSLYQAAFTPSNNYAVTFVAYPSTNVFFEPQSSSSNSAWIMNTGGPSTTRPTEFFLVRPNNAAISGSIYVTAYGFWK